MIRGLFVLLAVATPCLWCTRAVGQTCQCPPPCAQSGQVSAKPTFYKDQGAPLGRSIFPQGTYLLQNLIFDKITVDIGTMQNGLFTPLPGYDQRAASVDQTK